MEEEIPPSEHTLGSIAVRNLLPEFKIFRSPLLKPTWRRNSNSSSTPREVMDSSLSRDCFVPRLASTQPEELPTITADSQFASEFHFTSSSNKKRISLSSERDSDDPSSSLVIERPPSSVGSSFVDVEESSPRHRIPSVISQTVCEGRLHIKKYTEPQEDDLEYPESLDVDQETHPWMYAGCILSEREAQSGASPPKETLSKSARYRPGLKRSESSEEEVICY